MRIYTSKDEAFYCSDNQPVMDSSAFWDLFTTSGINELPKVDEIINAVIIPKQFSFSSNSQLDTAVRKLCHFQKEQVNGLYL